MCLILPRRVLWILKATGGNGKDASTHVVYEAIVGGNVAVMM